MEKIGRKIWTYLPDQGDRPVLAEVDEVARSAGYEVSSYFDLVDRVAAIGYLNSRYRLFFRGQGTDYRIRTRDGRTGVSSIYASLYRSRGRSLPRAERLRRLEKLDWYTQALHRSFPGSSRWDRTRLRKFSEPSWALLQHYQVCDTPLLDISQSLHVASSFATLGKEAGDVYLYVLGMPDVAGALSYRPDEGVVLVRLQSVCPPAAKRAHRQEGYLVGQFPWEMRKYASLNWARRLVAKFVLRVDSFWDVDLPAIREVDLMPETDDLLDYFDDLEEYRI